MRVEINDQLKYSLESRPEPTCLRFMHPEFVVETEVRDPGSNWETKRYFIEINDLGDLVSLAKYCYDGIRVEVEASGEMHVSEFTMEYRT